MARKPTKQVQDDGIEDIDAAMEAILNGPDEAPAPAPAVPAPVEPAVAPVTPAPAIAINIETSAPSPEAPALPASTLREMEAGRAALARHAKGG